MYRIFALKTGQCDYFTCCYSRWFLAHRWLRFSYLTLVLAILVGWAVLHFGPKQLTAVGVAYETMDEASRNKQRTHAFKMLAVPVVGLLILGMNVGWLDARLREGVLSARYRFEFCRAGHLRQPAFRSSTLGKLRDTHMSNP